MAKSTINIKSTEISERTMTINHSVANGQSLVISVRDEFGVEKVLLDITAGEDYMVRINATITDELARP